MQIDTGCLMVLMLTIFRRNDSKPFKNNTSTRSKAVHHINEHMDRIVEHIMLKDEISRPLNHLASTNIPLRSSSLQAKSIFIKKSNKTSQPTASNLTRKARIHQTAFRNESHVSGMLVFKTSQQIVNINQRINQSAHQSTNNSEINQSLQLMSLAAKKERNNSFNFTLSNETENQNIKITSHSAVSPSQTKPPKMVSYNSPFQLGSNDSRPDDINKSRRTNLRFYSGKIIKRREDIIKRASLLVLDSIQFRLTTSYRILSDLIQEKNSPFQLGSNKTRIDDKRIESVPYCSDPKAPCACDVIPRVVVNQDKNENTVNEFVCNMEKTDLTIIPRNFRCQQLFLKKKMKSMNKFVTVKSGCELRCIADCKE